MNKLKRDKLYVREAMVLFFAPLAGVLASIFIIFVGVCICPNLIILWIMLTPFVGPLVACAVVKKILP